MVHFIEYLPVAQKGFVVPLPVAGRYRAIQRHYMLSGVFPLLASSSQCPAGYWRGDHNTLCN
jgi:hypothetical protein